MVIIVFCFLLLVFLHFSQRQNITKSYLRVSNFDAVQDGPKFCINHCNNVALASTGRNSAIDSWGGSCVMNLMRSKTNSKIVNNGFIFIFRVLRADRREQPAILVGCTLHKFRESDFLEYWQHFSMPFIWNTEVGKLMLYAQILQEFQESDSGFWFQVSVGGQLPDWNA